MDPKMDLSAVMEHLPRTAQASESKANIRSDQVPFAVLPPSQKFLRDHQRIQVR
jgi:hypothetical protein